MLAYRHLAGAEPQIGQAQRGERHPVVRVEHRGADEAIERAVVVGLVEMHEAERMQGCDIARMAADERMADRLRAVELALLAQPVRLFQLLARVARGVRRPWQRIRGS